MNERENIQKAIERLRKKRQSPEREADIAILELELREVVAWHELHVAQKARLLFRAYRNTGRMTVMHPNGQRRDGNPYTSVDPVQAVWNVRNEAENLARWALS